MGKTNIYMLIFESAQTFKKRVNDMLFTSTYILLTSNSGNGRLNTSDQLFPKKTTTIYILKIFLKALES